MTNPMSLQCADVSFRPTTVDNEANASPFVTTMSGDGGLSGFDKTWSYIFDGEIISSDLDTHDGDCVKVILPLLNSSSNPSYIPPAFSTLALQSRPNPTPLTTPQYAVGVRCQASALYGWGFTLTVHWSANNSSSASDIGTGNSLIRFGDDGKNSFLPNLREYNYMFHGTITDVSFQVHSYKCSILAGTGCSAVQWQCIGLPLTQWSLSVTITVGPLASPSATSYPPLLQSASTGIGDEYGNTTTTRDAADTAEGSSTGGVTGAAGNSTEPEDSSTAATGSDCNLNYFKDMRGNCQACGAYSLTSVPPVSVTSLQCECLPGYFRPVGFGWDSIIMQNGLQTQQPVDATRCYKAVEDALGSLLSFTYTSSALVYPPEWPTLIAASALSAGESSFEQSLSQPSSVVGSLTSQSPASFDPSLLDDSEETQSIVMSSAAMYSVIKQMTQALNVPIWRVRTLMALQQSASYQWAILILPNEVGSSAEGSTSKVLADQLLQMMSNPSSPLRNSRGFFRSLSELNSITVADVFLCLSTTQPSLSYSFFPSQCGTVPSPSPSGGDTRASSSQMATILGVVGGLIVVGFVGLAVAVVRERIQDARRRQRQQDGSVVDSNTSPQTEQHEGQEGVVAVSTGIEINSSDKLEGETA